MKIDSLAIRNRVLKQKVDELESISFFSWCSWFLFGERWQTRRALKEFESD
jgi:hypothetical protein